VTLDPLISFSTKFSGASNNGTRFRSSRLKSSSISGGHEIGQHISPKIKEKEKKWGGKKEGARGGREGEREEENPYG
jgi:hypothetical protein